MEGGVNVSSIIQALDALYHNHNDSALQAQANTYLINVSESAPNAAALAIELLSSENHYYQGKPEVVYFSCNILKSKITKHDLVSRLAQHELQSALNTLMSCIPNNRTSTASLCQVTCLFLLYIPDMEARSTKVKEFLNALLSNQHHYNTSVALLHGFCEELDRNDAIVEKEELQMMLRSTYVPPVLTYLKQDNNSIKALHPWLRLSGLSLTSLSREYPDILSSLLNLLQSSLQTVMVVLCDLFNITDFPVLPETSTVLQTVVSVLCSLCRRNTTTDDDTYWHSVTLLVSTFAEANVDWIATSDDNAEFIELMLFLTRNHHQRSSAVLCIDFWLDLGDIPVSRRRGSLIGNSVFTRLLSVIISQCASSSSDNTTIDDDEEHNFLKERERIYPDVASLVLNLISEKVFISIILQTLVENSNNIESCVFILSSREVVSDIQNLETVFSQVMVVIENLITNEVTACNPLLTRSICKFFKSYGTTTSSVVMVSYCCNALLVPMAQDTASVALREFCIKTNSVTEEGLNIIISALHQSIMTCSLSLENAQVVVEGIVRRSACNSSTCTAGALERLVSLLVSSATIGSSNSNGDIFLWLLSTVIRFTTKDLHKVVCQSLWNPIHQMAERYPDAAFECYNYMLCSNDNMSELQTIGSYIIATWYRPSTLRCTSTIIEVFKDKTDLVPLISSLCNSAIAEFDSRLQSNVESLQAFYDMLYKAALFCSHNNNNIMIRGVITSHDVITKTLGCIENTHRESTRSVLVFLKYVNSLDLLDNHSYAQETAARIINGLSSGTSPTVLFASLSDCLYQVVDKCDSEVLLQILRQNYSKSNTTLRDTFLNLATAGKKARFKSLCIDFAKVCRSEIPEEMLLDHFYYS